MTESRTRGEGRRAPAVAELESASVVIAGGTGGVGLAAAHAFARSGVPRIALLGRSTDRGEAAAAAVRAASASRVEFVRTDATDADSTLAAIDGIHAAFGSVDVAVSSVPGQHGIELLTRTDPHEIAATLAALALPPMHLTRAVLPIMQAQGGGSVITVASDAAKVPTPGESVIGAAMAAIVLFSKTVALEAKRDGIRVNVVTPSLIAGTESTARILADGLSKRIFEKAAALAHLGVVEPDDVAALIVFLGSPAAARLTGQAISVNGGISIA